MSTEKQDEVGIAWRYGKNKLTVKMTYGEAAIVLKYPHNDAPDDFVFLVNNLPELMRRLEAALEDQKNAR